MLLIRGGEKTFSPPFRAGGRTPRPPLPADPGLPAPVRDPTARPRLNPGRVEPPRGVGRGRRVPSKVLDDEGPPICRPSPFFFRGSALKKKLFSPRRPSGSSRPLSVRPSPGPPDSASFPALPLTSGSRYTTIELSWC